MKRSTFSAILISSLVFVAGAALSGSANQPQSSTVRLCVDNRTKEVKFSGNWKSCPRGHTPLRLGSTGPQGPVGPAGPAGPSGSTVSIFTTLLDCQKRLEFALASGFLMVRKIDREYFESSTGCIVEKIRPEGKIAISNAARSLEAPYLRVPIISDWKLVELTGAGEGDWSAWNTEAIYEVTVSNLREGYEFCQLEGENQVTGSRYVETTEDGKALISTTLFIRPYSLIAQLEVGVRPVGEDCHQLGSWPGHAAMAWLDSYVTVHEDPLELERFFPQNGSTLEHLTMWGWR